MDKDDFVNLGRSIVDGRKKLGFSQKQFARKVSISSSNLNDIEQGATNPSAFTVYKIGKLLNTNLFKTFD